MVVCEVLGRPDGTGAGWDDGEPWVLDTALGSGEGEWGVEGGGVEAADEVAEGAEDLIGREPEGRRRGMGSLGACVADGVALDGVEELTAFCCCSKACNCALIGRASITPAICRTRSANAWAATSLGDKLLGTDEFAASWLAAALASSCARVVESAIEGGGGAFSNDCTGENGGRDEVEGEDIDDPMLSLLALSFVEDVSDAVSD
jgi:hypothetical protein